MVSEKLVDFSRQKDAIVTGIKKIKNSKNLYKSELHDIFKPSKFNIDDLELIITSIENKLRKIEMIYFTYFNSEYDSSIIVDNVVPSSVEGMITNKIIETKFDFGVSILKNRVDIDTPILYKEIINTQFQSFILSVASLYEVLVKLCETLLKKIAIHIGNKAPSVRLDNFVLYWDILVELDYRKDDEFYKWRLNHRNFIDKYLNQINTLRNRFIHGYSINLEINHKKYIVSNYDTKNFRPVSGDKLITELILDNFTENILLNTRKLTTEILDLFVKKLSRPRKIPM